MRTRGNMKSAEESRQVGRNIRKWRKSAKLTQAQLAEKIGLTQGAVTSYENGRRNVPLETAQKIADALDVPIVEIIEDKQCTLDALPFATAISAAIDIPPHKLNALLDFLNANDATVGIDFAELEYSTEEANAESPLDVNIELFRDGERITISKDDLKTLNEYLQEALYFYLFRLQKEKDT